MNFLLKMQEWMENLPWSTDDFPLKNGRLLCNSRCRVGRPRPSRWQFRRCLCSFPLHLFFIAPAFKCFLFISLHCSCISPSFLPRFSLISPSFLLHFALIFGVPTAGATARGGGLAVHSRQPRRGGCMAGRCDCRSIFDWFCLFCNCFTTELGTFSIDLPCFTTGGPDPPGGRWVEMMNFILQTRNFVSKMRNCVLKTRNFVFVFLNDEFCRLTPGTQYEPRVPTPPNTHTSQNRPKIDPT